MFYKVRLTVIDKKLYPELQREYCKDPEAGACPCYNVGDEFIFERYDDENTFWRCGLNRLVKTSGDPGQGRRRSEDAILFGAMGFDLQVHMGGPPRRVHHEGVDGRPACDDCLLLRRYEAGHFQDR